MSRKAEWLRQIEKEKGIESPTLKDEPVLGPHLFSIWKGFCELSSRRPIVGMGDLGYIPYSEIESYCRLKNMFLPSEVERFVNFVVTLDMEWMKHHVAESEKKNRPKGSPPPPSHSPPRHKPHRSTTTRV